MPHTHVGEAAPVLSVGLDLGRFSLDSVGLDQGHKVWETLIRMTCPQRSCLAGFDGQNQRSG